ncbi:hypothetical protein [Pseudomonas aeruginosa]|uniref:hypothetical protein n=1 Tax=Pseudomonas aeruginosa TaxID=287 RepID=UPI0022BA2209|nr:hypothetical protein [Pseudomonas aeruginosa]WBH59130.1 hypothetical protein PALA9_03861 [Pseudomonas aeruginosa]
MPVRHWPAVLLALAVLCGLSGCSGNYKFNDGDYRPRVCKNIPVNPCYDFRESHRKGRP